MKIKSILYLLALLIVFAGENLYAQTSKNLVAMAYRDGEGSGDLTVFSYDASNRLTSIKDNVTVTLIDWTNFANGEVKMTFKSESTKYETVFTIDEQGRAINSVTKNENGIIVVTNEFGYDKNGYLRSVKDKGMKEKLSSMIYISPRETKFTYIDGTLVSMVLSTQNGNYDASMTFKNGTKMNTGNMDFSSMLWGFDVSTTTFIDNASMAGLLGKSINILPNLAYFYEKYKDENEEEEEEVTSNITYQLDKDSYPKSLTISSPENGTTTIDFVWE